MSFAQKTESPALTPTTPDRRNTYREAEAVPFGNGYFRVAPKWITDRFNDHWSNGKTTGQAYCSVAGVLCHGPIQHVRAIYAGGDLVAVLDVSRPTSSLDSDYYYTTIEFGGTDADLGVTNRVRFYWGDEAQPVDTWLTSTTGQDHPPYKGQTLVVFERLHCGQIQANSQARPALPNIEFTVYRLPSPSMPSGLRFPDALPGGVAQFRGVNILSATWDFLTHARGGLGLTSTSLDQSDWTMKAEDLQDGTKPASGIYGEEAYLSPLLTGQQDADKIIQDAMQYIDGWVYADAGKIRVNYFPNDGTVPAPLPTITEDDHVEPPQIQTASLSESPTTIVVELLEGDSGELDLIDAVETVNVPFVREITTNSVVKKLQRPWITSRDIGAKYAARAAGLATIPAKSGESVVRLDRAIRLDGTPLRVGDIFTLNYAPMSELVTARLIERLEDETTATLRWERERGTSSVPYAPPTDERDNYVWADPATPGTGDWTVLEAPSALSADAAVVVLAQRPADTVAGLRLYLDADGDWAAGATLLGIHGFAAKVTLGTTINSSVTACVLNGAGVDVSPFLGSGATGAEQEDDTLLLLMGSEWMSIGAVSSAGAGSYNAAILRARVGSAAASHTSADAGWVIRRDRLSLWRHATFEQTETRYFKILYYHAKADGPLSAAKSITFADRSPGVVTSLTATALPEGVRLDWVEPADRDVLVYEIFEHPTTTQPADPVHFCPAPANSYVRLGATAGDSLKFWVRTKDEAGNMSASVGPVTVVVESAGGATLMYRGAFSASDLYYDNDDIQNIVSVGSSYYKVNNTSKNGQDGTSWGTPPGANWIAFASIPALAATDLLLAKDVVILKKLTLGDGTSSAGQLVTSGVTGYGTGSAGIFLGMDGTTPKIYVGSSARSLSWNGSALAITADTITLGSNSYPLTLDIDSSFIGANPPARMTFGSMVANATAGGATTLSFSDGGLKSSAFAAIHSPAYGITYNYGIALNTGDARFRELRSATTLYVGANAVALTSPSASTLTVPASIRANALGADNAGTFEFFAGVGNAAVYVRNQDFEVRNSSGVTKFAVTGSTGATAVAGLITGSAGATITGQVYSDSILTTAQCVIGSYLTVGNSSSSVINFHTDTVLYRGGANILRTDDSFRALNVTVDYDLTVGDDCVLQGATSVQNQFNVRSTGLTIHFEVLPDYDIVRVRKSNFIVADSSATTKLEVTASTGDVAIQGNRVLSTRTASAPTTLADVISALQHHGLVPT